MTAAILPSFIGRYHDHDVSSSIDDIELQERQDLGTGRGTISKMASRTTPHPSMIESITITRTQRDDGKWIRIKETMLQNGARFFEERIAAPLQQAMQSRQSRQPTRKQSSSLPSQQQHRRPRTTRTASSAKLYETVATHEEQQQQHDSQELNTNGYHKKYHGQFFPSKSVSWNRPVPTTRSPRSTLRREYQYRDEEDAPRSSTESESDDDQEQDEGEEQDMTSVIIPLDELNKIKQLTSSRRLQQDRLNVTTRLLLTASSLMVFMVIASWLLSSSPSSSVKTVAEDAVAGLSGSST
mmetsp:Transcript_25649/g.71692  ORF Transcript_25649/g.71692 Transcript_25649/m.71692 type:complete len:297 (-) Transcript_25649:221-1111(-)